MCHTCLNRLPALYRDTACVSGPHQTCHGPGRVPNPPTRIQAEGSQTHPWLGLLRGWESGVRAKLQERLSKGHTSAPLGNLAFSVWGNKAPDGDSDAQSGGEQLIETPRCQVLGRAVPELRVLQQARQQRPSLSSCGKASRSEVLPRTAHVLLQKDLAQSLETQVSLRAA